VPGDQLRAEAEAFARKLAVGPTLAFGGIKALLRTWDRAGVAAADAVTVRTIAPVMASERATSTIAAYLKRIASN